MYPVPNKIYSERFTLPVYLLFLLLLLGFRWLWTENFAIPEQPHPVKGVLDLRGWDMKNSSPLSLDGEWIFYPRALYTHQDLAAADDVTSKAIQVPGDWRSVMPKASSSFGFGTYRLRILLDDSVQEVALWAQKIQASTIVEMNGSIVAQFGQPASNKQDYYPQRSAFTVSYALEDASELEILVRTANFDDPFSGGITRSIYFGSEEAITGERGLSIDLQKITVTVLLLHSIYACFMWFFNRRQRSLLIFSLLIFSVVLTVVSDHDELLLHWLPLNFTWMVKVKILSYPLVSLFMLMLARSFTDNSRGNRFFLVYVCAFSLYCGFVMSAPIAALYYSIHYGVGKVFYLLPIIWSVYLFLRMVITRQNDAMYLLFAVTSSLSSALWGMLNSYREITTVYYPIDVLLAVFCFSIYWFKKYFRNTAEIQRLYEQLQEEDRQKDQFLANTAHELRTPLHGILSIAQNMVSKNPAIAEVHPLQDMKLLISIGRRMSQLVDDLLDVVRLKENRIRLHKELLLLPAVMSGVIDMLKFMTGDKAVEIIMDCPDPQLLVHADERRLVQILYNLLHNAVKYTDEGKITVFAEEAAGQVVIRVSDSGIGISEDMQKRIFDAYVQGTPEGQMSRGIGLGLSICKQLIELHGGTLSVQSVLGSGSTFQITLPVEDSAALSAHEVHQHAPFSFGESEVARLLQDIPVELDPIQFDPLHYAIAHAKILAVDDDPVNLRVLASILSGEVYHVHSVTSAQEALKSLEKEHWDLLIADVMMPGMSGYELTRIVREHYSAFELPILLLTARNEPSDIYSGFRVGATDYVTKPVDSIELKHRIASLINMKQSVDERLRMEAAYLQAQIQPHFFFNTLNSIMALADLDTVRMQKLADAFIAYLQTSFDFLNSEKMVAISHEIELTQSYLYIEKERFEERLNIIWELPPDLYLLLPPLTIQPLVENAVRHGVMRKRSGGTVKIRIVRQEQHTLIEVVDDGVGMDSSQIDKILEWPLKGSTETGGIGLKNTHRRIKQIYGQGLTIRSKPGEGTSVSFIIPVRPS